jgi:hypothetical protein
VNNAQEANKRVAKAVMKSQLMFNKNFVKQQSVLSWPTKEFLEKKGTIVITPENTGTKGALKTI